MPFKLSTRGHYAVILMCELAERKTFVSLSEISESRKISRGYLEHIVRPLRKANLVSGKRGAYGGYALARPADSITVGEVIRVVEGPILPVSCAAENFDVGNCPDDCRARIVWQKVSAAIERVLDSITLENLIREDMGLGRSNQK